MNNFDLSSFSFNSGDLIIIRAKPNSSKSEIVWNEDMDRFDVFLHSIPDNGKANLELIKLFKKQFKLRVELVSGFKGRDKKVMVL